MASSKTGVAPETDSPFKANGLAQCTLLSQRVPMVLRSLCRKTVFDSFLQNQLLFDEFPTHSEEFFPFLFFFFFLGGQVHRAAAIGPLLLFWGRDKLCGRFVSKPHYTTEC